MKYYTEIVPFEVAKKLKDAGFPQYHNKGPWYNTFKELRLFSVCGDAVQAPTYAKAFDWLIEKGIAVEMERTFKEWCAFLCPIEPDTMGSSIFHGPTFHKAANAAIEKACEILKGNG